MSKYCVPNYFHDKGEYSYMADFIRQYIIAKYPEVFKKPNHFRFEILEKELGIALDQLTKGNKTETSRIITYYDNNKVFHTPENGGILNGFLTGNRRELKNFIDCLRPPKTSDNQEPNRENNLQDSENQTQVSEERTNLNSGGRRMKQAKRTRAQRKKSKTFKPRRHYHRRTTIRRRRMN